MRSKLEILALVLGFIGLAGILVATGLPMWKATAFIGPNLITFEVQWEGLWMNCIRQADFRMQCKVYDSVLILPEDIQAARGLMCASIILSLVAFLMAATGVCQEKANGKNVIFLLGGCIFLLAAVTTLVPIAWCTYTIITDFYSPVVDESQKREIGQSLFVGFAAVVLLLASGIIILVRYFSRRENVEENGVYYVPAPKTLSERTHSHSDSYEKSQYI